MYHCRKKYSFVTTTSYPIKNDYNVGKLSTTSKIHKFFKFLLFFPRILNFIFGRKYHFYSSDSFKFFTFDQIYSKYLCLKNIIFFWLSFQIQLMFHKGNKKKGSSFCLEFKLSQKYFLSKNTGCTMTSFFCIFSTEDGILKQTETVDLKNSSTEGFIFITASSRAFLDSMLKQRRL